MTAPRAESCVECGAELVLFQPTCRRCETAHEWEYRAPCHDCGEQVAYDGACPHCGSELSIWRALEADVLGRDEQLTVWKASVPRPLTAGYRVHLGSVQGQWVDYRRSLGEGGEMHIRSYHNRYELHHDDVSALDSPGRHLLRHGLPAAIASGTELGARAGKTVARSGTLLRRALQSPYAWLGTNRDDEDSGKNIG
jgi:hypothetical protein